MDETADLLREQIAYYRARAAEYDEDMWQRDTRDVELREAFGAVRRRCEALPVTGQVLELGCGTGSWTEWLAARADHVLALDAAPEMVALARRKLTGVDNVRIEVEDVFSWEPTGTFDVVFFSFLLSHVPAPLESRFWHQIARSVAPGGTAVFVDSAPWFALEEQWLAGGVVRRRLRNGSEFRIVKRYPTASELTGDLARHGWRARVDVVEDRFLVGEARPG